MHHFISYSSFDALDFALSLADSLVMGPPTIPCWIDKRNLINGIDWDTQIDDSIRICESLIFVMTKDSVKNTSICKNEWSQALTYKKPIIPVRLHNDAVLPFRLNSRQYIDFSINSSVGLARLRQHLLWLLTPEGQLQCLKDRLNDAHRYLDRVENESRDRVEKEIEELQEEINRLEKIRENPETAAAQSQQSIKVRLDSERQPIPQVEMGKRVKFVHQPPMFAPPHFQDRFVETGVVADFLKNDSRRIITLIGRGGIGKTAMICRLMKSLEQGILPDDRGKFDVGGMVYLHETGLNKIGFANLFGDLCILLPREIANNQEKIYKDGQRSVRFKMFSLLEEFRAEPVIVLLDNLENAIDPETCTFIEEDLRDALLALLEAPHHPVKIIITTRIPPRDILLIHPERQQTLHLDSGLGSPFAENILRALDSDGSLGIRDAPDSILTKIREYTRGFPRALEIFCGSLTADISTTVEELLSKIQNVPDQKIVEILVGEAFSRLDKNAQIVMQALAIFSRPVPAVAVDFLLQPYTPSPDSAQILNRLVNMHFVRREHGRYYMHPVDLAYALSRIPPEPQEGITAGQIYLSKRGLRKRASEYFRLIRRPREEWKNLTDIDPQLSEFELRCDAEDYETALWIVNDIDNNYLTRWGHAGMVVEMRKKLVGKLTDDSSVCVNMALLGSAYLQVGKSLKAIEYNEPALSLCQKNKDSFTEAFTLNVLAIANRRIGQISKAIEMYERSMIIDRNLASTANEAITLNNLGVAYRYLGLLSKSIEYHNQAINLQRTIHDLRDEGVSLGTQAVALRYIGQIQKAIDLSTQALEIARAENDRHWEAYHCAELGSSYLDMGDLQKGSDSLKKAVEIAHETADSHFQAVWLVRLRVKELLFGDFNAALDILKHDAELVDERENSQYMVDYRLARAMAELRSARLEESHRAIEPVLQTEYILHLLDILTVNGIVLLRQGKRKEAIRQFNATIAHADKLLKDTAQFYSAIEAKGVAACGLAICEEKMDSQYVTHATKYYSEARSIVTAPGVVKRALFFFDECAKADEHGILRSVRGKVEGN